jgi:hypothetical protein
MVMLQPEVVTELGDDGLPVRTYVVSSEAEDDLEEYRAAWPEAQKVKSRKSHGRDTTKLRPSKRRYSDEDDNVEYGKFSSVCE